jgi:hypothetical protein
MNLDCCKNLKYSSFLLIKSADIHSNYWLHYKDVISLSMRTNANYRCPTSVSHFNLEMLHLSCIHMRAHTHTSNQKSLNQGCLIICLKTQRDFISELLNFLHTVLTMQPIFSQF